MGPIGSERVYPRRCGACFKPLLASFGGQNAHKIIQNASKMTSWACHSWTPDGLTAAAEGTQNTICCGHHWVPSIMLFAIDGVSVRPQNSCEASIWRDLDLLKCYRSRQKQTKLSPQTTNPGSGCRWPHG
eukprot:gene8930-biopygen10692